MDSCADNPRVRYLYEDPAYPFALTGILDETGTRVATYTYDAQGRAILSELAASAERFTVAHDDVANTRTVTGPLGRVSIFQFTTLQGIPKLTRIDGQASTSMPKQACTTTTSATTTRRSEGTSRPTPSG